MASAPAPENITIVPACQGIRIAYVLTASATFPLVASAGSGPIYAEGEEGKWVRVASALGGPSTVTYITASGKEVPATALASRLQ